MGLRDDIDTRLAQLWTVIVSRQTTFFNNRGYYWQGLLWQSRQPVDGELLTLDRLDAAPAHQPISWRQAGWNNGSERFALAIDAYEGPLGHGFVARVYVTINGRTWTRSRNRGPEDWRTTAWREITEGPARAPRS